jgi:hypothetical protein
MIFIQKFTYHGRIGNDPIYLIDLDASKSERDT